MVSVPFTLESAAKILEILARCRIERDPEPSPDVPSFVATLSSPFVGLIRKRVVLVDQPADLELATTDDEVGLLVLTRSGLDTHGGPLALDSAAHGERKVEVQSWSSFISAHARLPGIAAQYRRLREEYRDTEGEDFLYIDPTVVDEDDLLTQSLRAWVEGHEATGFGGMVYLVAEYGEGKTSFCLNYAFRSLEYASIEGGIPLLFALSELEAGSIQGFVTERLAVDYGLSLSHLEFQQLCQLGLFVPVFDAFDQMQHGAAAAMRLERDYNYFSELASTAAPLYVTCRLDYFNQHVRPLRDRERRASPTPASHLLALRGFDSADVSERLRDYPELIKLLSDPSNQAVLQGIHHKPLMLHVIARHSETFAQLVEERRSSWTGEGDVVHLTRVTEFDVFNLLYEQWLDTDFQALVDVDEAIRLCRAITARAQLDGMNLPLPFSRLWGEMDIGVLLDTSATEEAVLDDLKHLPFLDQAKLRRGKDPVVVFRFNAYLEFLTARFVLDELRGRSLVEGSFIRMNPLTRETRQMIVPELTLDEHAGMLNVAVSETRHKHFTDVAYQGTNALTLILDKLQEVGAEGDGREDWIRLLQNVRRQKAVLRLLDARGADLTDIDFSDCDLRDSDFSYAILRGTSFASADLEGARFEEMGPLLTTVLIRRQELESEQWHLVGGTRNGMLVFFDSDSSYSSRVSPHREEVKALEMHWERGRVYSVSLDGAFCITETEDPHTTRRYPLAIGGLRAMVLSPDGNTVLIGGDRRDAAVVVRDLRNASSYHLALPTGSSAVITSMVIDEGSKMLFVGDSEGHIYTFTDWQDGASAELLNSEELDSIESLIVLSEDELLALTTEGQMLVLNNLGEPVELPFEHGDTSAVCFAAEVDTLYWVEGSRLFKWNRRDARFSLPSHVTNLPRASERTILACSDNGRFVAMAGDQLMVWRSGFAGMELVKERSMLMDCEDMNISGSRGLSADTRAFLISRGAIPQP